MVLYKISENNNCNRLTCYLTIVILNSYNKRRLTRLFENWGWSGGAMVLGKLPVPGRPTIWVTVGQGPTALAIGAGGAVWTFLLSTILSFLCLPLWEAARYRLKYCFKWPTTTTTLKTMTKAIGHDRNFIRRSRIISFVGYR